MELIARPIDQWPGRPLRKETERKATDFTASWGDTQALLRKEVEMLAGDDVTVILQMAVTERQCRNDGWIRADATPEHPGIIISFKDAFGKQLRFSTDLFTNRGWRGYLGGWQSNVRAVALGLEALRRVERYGLGMGDEQYRGFAAIGAESATPLGAGTAMTREEAARVLIDAAHFGVTADQLALVLTDAPTRASVYKVAAANTHPDREGGNEAAFKLVSTAKAVLDGKL